MTGNGFGLLPKLGPGHSPGIFTTVRE